MSSSQLFNPSPQPAPSALVQVESSRAVQEVQASLVIAKKFPRDQVAAMDRIKNACTRPSLANVAVYQYARAGTDITGPSIRLAEAIAQQWGNLTFGFTELEQVGGASTIEAYCWDLETNTKRSVTFQVPHQRHTKSGVKELTDPRDIYELVANNASRRVRACILATIPGDVVEAALEQCDETMRADADTSPEMQKKILAGFAKFGVSKEQIEKRIQRRLEAIQPAQVVSLKKIHSSLRDGMSKPDEWFDEIVPTSADSKLLTKVETAAPTASPSPEIEQPSRLEPEPEKSLVDRAKDRGIGTRKQTETPPADLLEVASVSLADSVRNLAKSTKITWGQANLKLKDNGYTDEEFAVPEDAPEELLREAISSWAAIVKLVRGGAK